MTYHPKQHRKQIFTLCAGLMAGSAGIGAAAAQSTDVTLFGLVDISVISAKGKTASKTGLVDGTDYGPGSRWGLRVTEDLGSGLKVGAVLESGFLTTTGQAAQGGRLFGRQSYLWLRSDTVGELRLGRQYILHDWVLADVNPTGSTTVVNPTIAYTLAASGGYFSPMITTARIDQSVQYLSPTFAGLQLQLMHAFKQDVQDGYTGVKLNYTGGALKLTAAYEQSRALDASVRSSSTVNKMWSAGGSYDFEVVQLFVGYQRVRNLSQATTPTHIGGVDLNLPGLTGAATKMDAYSAGVSVPVGDTTYFANYVHARYTDAAKQKASIANYGVGAAYALSKRTTVYGALALAGGDLKNSIYEKRIVQLGLRHAF